MSADNWAVCPRCVLERTREVDALDIDLGNAYGQVPIEEFDRMRAERNTLAASEPERTFREDYEIYGAEDGVVTVSYSGSCSRCTLSLSFNESHPLDVGGEL